jgi:hypothetical protein
MSGILTEYHALHTADSRSIDDLSRLVAKLRKLHKDMQTLGTKAAEILDSGSYRIPLKVRQDATKLCQQLDTNMNTIVKSINEFSS